MARAKRAITSSSRKSVKSASAADSANGNGEVHVTALEDQIRLRAYQLFEERGRAHGNDLADWFRAEAELIAREGRAKSQIA